MRLLILTNILWLTAAAWCAPQPRIELHEISTVRDAQFTLGEIAAIAGVDADTQARLAKVVLGSSPLPGLERTITLEQVRTRLRQHGFEPERFELIVPARVTIRRQKCTIDPEQIAHAAIAKVRLSLALPSDALVECDAPIRPLSVVDGSPQIIAGDPRTLGGGLYLVPVQVTDASGMTQGVHVRLRVLLQRKVVVAKRAIQRGEAIDAETIALVPMTLRHDDSHFMNELPEALGKIARRALSAGQPIRRSDLDTAAVVRRGQNLKLLVRLHGAVVEADAVALQDGKAGARIRVQVTDTRKTLLATVLSAEAVSVDVL
jgi:flagella basal body P-ring formation protein FlgA